MDYIIFPKTGTTVHRVPERCGQKEGQNDSLGPSMCLNSLTEFMAPILTRWMNQVQ